jgi:hypothetical protein
MKLTSIDDLTDEIIGKPGTKEREIFENKLRKDVLRRLKIEAHNKNL